MFIIYVVERKRSSRTIFSKNVIENPLFRLFQTQVNANLSSGFEMQWRLGNLYAGLKCRKNSIQ
jgi:hypothetical protein